MKDEIIRLYIIENKSRAETAKILNITERSLKRILLKENIKKDKQSIQQVRERRMLELYGKKTPMEVLQFKENLKKNNIKKYGVDNRTKVKEIALKISNSSKGKIISNKQKEQIRNTLTGRKVEESKLRIKLAKEYSTKKLHNSFNFSKPENEIHQLLLQKFSNVERQYYSELYPFACDFYIKSLNLYIEFQGTWTHGDHPFNSNSSEDLKKLELWKSKNSKFYNNAIKVWTESDPKKRQIAKNNNLNWIEFFNLEEFYKWYSSI